LTTSRRPARVSRPSGLPALAAGPGGLRILGVDPGLLGTGYGLLESRAGAAGIVTSGVIATPSHEPLETRVATIYAGVLRLLEEHAPSVLALEDLYTEYSFPRTALLMAHARGVVCLAATQRAIPVVALAPAEVKRAVAGHGTASKAQIQRGVQRLLRLDAEPEPTHVADALAIAWTALSRLGRPR
jgi:crossover junction endodeoxyribonuclease RuvC